MTPPALDRWAQGFKGPWIAALIALIAGLPGVFALPPLDRDESRFAQASAQMLETGDIVAINFQDQPRDKKPVGIYWLQAMTVDALSSPEARSIWAYRLPSLLGAMAAAAACAWGAAALFRPGTALIAGALLGSTFLLSTEATIAKTDAVLCAAVTLMMAAFARIYAASREDTVVAKLGTRWVFWSAMAVAALVKGPVGPLIALMAGLLLWAWDRKAPWARTMEWGWGVVILAAVIGPWAWAITVTTDGGFWGSAVAGDLAPKLVSGDESHGAPPGVHLLLAPILFFPGSLLLPAGVAWAWRHRKETAARAAVAWLVPTWLMFELLPTKLVHYTLPAYGALAWLAAAALAEPIGKRLRWTGVGFLVFGAAILTALVLYLLHEHGDRSDTFAAALAVFFFVGAAFCGAWGFLREEWRPLALTLVLGVLGHACAVGLFAPRLEPLWLSLRVERALQGEGLDPRNGVTPGPVAVAGYGEPSLVFLLGTKTALTDGAGAAEAIGQGRPAVVEKRVDDAFRTALRERRLTARPVAIVRGVNYSDGDDEQLVIYHASRRAPPP
jgi:4-amino-4-deoxy-L-arabinose transferase-like glycosyltransferase